MTAKDVLRIRDFRNLWLGQAISQLGDSLYTLSFMFMVKKVTQSDAMVGLVGALEYLPFVLLGPLAGVLADRVDRRRIMVMSDWICFAVLIVFSAMALCQFPVPNWALFATPLFLSIARTTFMPAKSAAIPRLVPPEALVAANSVSMATQNFVPILGLAFTANVLALLYQLSPQMFLVSAVALNALSFGVSALFLRLLPPIEPENSSEPKHPLTDMKEGFSYLGKRSLLLVILGLSFVVSLLISPFYVVYVATNDAWFGGKPQVLAWFECAFFLGMVLGSFGVGALRIQRVGLAYVASLVIVGATVVGMAAFRSIPAHIALNFVAGLALPFHQIPIATLIQTTVDDAFRGRVNSAFWMVSAGVIPVGMSLGGLLIENLGIQLMYVIMGSGMALAAACGLLIPSFRQSRLLEG